MGAVAGPPVAWGGPFRTETEMRRKDGSTFWCRMSAKAVDPHRPGKGTIWIMEDVTSRRDAEAALQRAHDELEQRVLERTRDLTAANALLQREIFERMRAEQRIWHMAHHDALTGLPNRTLLHDRFEQALARARRGNHRVAVMFLDLDRFKSINDTLGHDVGDALLRHVAEKLRGVVRSVDTVSRLGGDEFVVVLHEIADSDDAEGVAGKVLSALSLPAKIMGHELATTPSIGISMFPDNGTEAMPLMKNADTAMYHAKAAGRNTFRFFVPNMAHGANNAIED